eukprot:XP_001695241.1 predicted protein [Chlamydomonas reinhardtii]
MRPKCWGRRFIIFAFTERNSWLVLMLVLVCSASASQPAPGRAATWAPGTITSSGCRWVLRPASWVLHPAVGWVWPPRAPDLMLLHSAYRTSPACMRACPLLCAPVGLHEPGRRAAAAGAGQPHGRGAGGGAV